MTQILKGHISPETAYVVEDYPYGFRLRCQIRYWLDCSLKRGVRLMSQTSNPKRAGLVWNKPKASTYCLFGGCMYLDDDGHVQWAGLHEYTNGVEASTYRDTYGAGVPDLLQGSMNDWVVSKVAFDKAIADGGHADAALRAAREARKASAA